MITVDCNEVLSIQHELLIHVSDQVCAIPAVKHHEFVLSPIDEEKIKKESVSEAIKDFLDSIGEINNFSIISNSDKITIKSVNGKKINRIPPPVRTMRTCCGLWSNQITKKQFCKYCPYEKCLLDCKICNPERKKNSCNC